MFYLPNFILMPLNLSLVCFLWLVTLVPSFKFDNPCLVLSNIELGFRHGPLAILRAHENAVLGEGCMEQRWTGAASLDGDGWTFIELAS
jgi:hypothetical protein